MSNVVPEGWVTQCFSDSVTLVYGKSPKEIFDENGEYPVVGTGGITGKTNSYLHEGCTTIVGRKGSINNPIFVASKFWAIDTTYYVSNYKNTDPKWFYYLLKNIDLVKYNEASGVPSLNRDTLYSIAYASPPLPEQKKIAAILTSVDEVIEKTQAQIDKLKDLKTAMMQELLTCGVGVDGKPHTEFKDSPVGRIPKGWEVKVLTDLAENLDSKRIPIKSEDRAHRKGEYRYYGASGIIDYVNDFIFNGEYILLGEDGENVLSRNLPLAFIVTGKFWVNNHAHVLSAKPGVDVKYLCEYLESIDYTNIASGSAQPKITKGVLNQLNIPVPAYEEQMKIGQILRSVDLRALTVKEKLTSLKNTKKALMQDLLTGKVRVKVD